MEFFYYYSYVADHIIVKKWLNTFFLFCIYITLWRILLNKGNTTKTFH